MSGIVRRCIQAPAFSVCVCISQVSLHFSPFAFLCLDVCLRYHSVAAAFMGR